MLGMPPPPQVPISWIHYNVNNIMTVYVEGGMTLGLAKMHGHGQNAWTWPKCQNNSFSFFHFKFSKSLTFMNCLSVFY